MRKLSGLDANFLYMETETAPQHVGSIQYLDVPDGEREQFFERLKDHLGRRLHLVPYLTNRLREVPGQLDHPVWVHEPNIDLNWHIQHITLPAPGSREQLDAKVAELYEPVMRRDRPMWQYWLIDGLADGSVALLNKIHHACIDGMAGTAALYALGDTQPEPREIEPPPAGFDQPETLDPGALLLESFNNLTRYAVEQWQRAPQQMEAAMRTLQQNQQRGETGRTPATSAHAAPWNKAIDSRRGVTGLHMHMPTLKTLAKQSGAKINDVVLAITAGALNRYLARKGVSYEGAMLAGCPVSLRKPGDTSMNNQVTMIGISMENQVADPIERIKAIHVASDEAKAALAHSADSVQTDFGAPFLPAMMTQAARATASGFGMDWLTEVPMNVVVSNVPGPRDELWLAGARITGYTPISIITHGAGLNVTVCSYVDRMELGLTAASKLIPDLDALRDDFAAAWEELAAQVRPVSVAAVAGVEAASPAGRVMPEAEAAIAA